jgi:preprotein translocase subunit SecD
MNPPIGWRLGLAVLLIATGLAGGCRQPTLQTSGGYVLTYRLAEGEKADLPQMAVAMQQRLVAANLPLAHVRSYEDGKLVVELPGADKADVAQAKDYLKCAGYLAFQIVADKVADQAVATAALADQPPPADVAADGPSFAWVRLDTNVSAVEDWMVVRDSESSEKEVLVLVSANDVTGNELESAARGENPTIYSHINVSLNSEGGHKMQLLTSGNIDRRLGIILDGKLLSWPVIRSTITSKLQITGQFTPEEADRIVTILKSGTLPARLADEPESVELVSPK